MRKLQFCVEIGSSGFLISGTASFFSTCSTINWSGCVYSHSRVAFSPDGAMLLTATLKNHVDVRQSETGNPQFPPIEPVLSGRRPCRDLAFSNDSRWLAAAVNGENTVQVWILITGRKTGESLPHPGDYYGIFSMAFNPDGHWILSGRKDVRLRLWD